GGETREQRFDLLRVAQVEQSVLRHASPRVWRVFTKLNEFEENLLDLELLPLVSDFAIYLVRVPAESSAKPPDVGVSIAGQYSTRAAVLSPELIEGVFEQGQVAGFRACVGK